MINYSSCFITWCQTTKVVQTPLLVSAHAWSVSDTNFLKRFSNFK